MTWPPILVRYGEIGIKSRSVRSQFERRLVERIEEQLVRRNVEAEVVRAPGRVDVRALDVDAALDALRHTFGVVSASPAREAPPTLPGIGEAVADVARDAYPPGASFAIRARRVGEHAFTSLDVARHAAGEVFAAVAERNPRVDLNAPDFAIRVDVREGQAFVSTRTVRGPGGLPLGSQGKVAVWVDDPRAAHAAWLMGKRGSALVFLASDPERAEAWLAPLAPWVPNLRAHPAPAPTRAQAWPLLRAFLERGKCQAMVVSDGLADQLARADEDRALGFPVFRPLVGYAGPRFQALCAEAELPEV